MNKPTLYVSTKTRKLIKQNTKLNNKYTIQYRIIYGTQEYAQNAQGWSLCSAIENAMHHIASCSYLYAEIKNNIEYTIVVDKIEGKENKIIEENK